MAKSKEWHTLKHWWNMVSLFVLISSKWATSLSWAWMMRFDRFFQNSSDDIEFIEGMNSVWMNIQMASLLNSIKIALILSHPSCSLAGSGLKKESSSFSITSSGLFPFILSSLILSMSPWLSFSYLSHTPSHPIMRKSSSVVSSFLVMSGRYVTACSS